MERIVRETCPNCNFQAEFSWDTETKGFEAVCPNCGKLLMLCDECLRAVFEDGEPVDCDWCEASQTCRRTKKQ